MSGDLRAKKNTRVLKTRGNKKEKGKRASQFQQSDSQEEYDGDHGMVDYNKAGEFLTGNKGDNVEEDDDDDDRIIINKPNRKTKRRELNKQILKRQGRHHRQQTPPPASRYNLDEDTASDDYEEYNQENERWTRRSNENTWGTFSLCTVLGTFVVIVTILGLGLFVVNHDDYKQIISNSESMKILAANLVLPDFQDIQNHLNVETVKTSWISLQDASSKGWDFTCYTINQFSVSATETCTNILKFINTVIVEIKSGEIFKETTQSPLQASNNPNDDSEDYSPELNEWIQSQETPKEKIETNKDNNAKLVDIESSNEHSDHLDVTRVVEQGYKESINLNKVLDVDKTETKVEPSFDADNTDASIKVTATSKPTIMDNRLVDEPVIMKTTAHTVG